MIAFPNAKINIGLNITERRADGYHNLETIFYPVKIKDALEVVDSDKLGFASSGIEIPGSADRNLCLKAYHLLKADFNLPPVTIHLHKHIPIGAGLGGGSSDAAFCIKVLNQKFELGLDGEQMAAYARQLGADCAFFVENQPVYAFEKGDRFEPVALNLEGYNIVVVMPPVHVSTAEAYRGVVPQPSSASLKELVRLPLGEWKHHIRNDFEKHILQNHPIIAEIKTELYAAGALYACMSGSGAAVFGIFDNVPDLLFLENHSQVFYQV